MVDKITRAVYRRDPTAIRRAIEAGEDVNAVDRTGSTPLMEATFQGDVESARALLAAGAHVNHQNHDGRTALHVAAQEFRLGAAKALLEAGARVDVANMHGNTPLFDAVFNSRGRGDMIQLLLQHGADRNRKNNHGVSPLSLAQTIANYDIAKFLE